MKSRATQSIEIVFAIEIALERYLLRDPIERDVWLGATQFLQGGLSVRSLPCHRCRCGQHPVRTDKVATLPERLTTHSHGILVFAPNKLAVGNDATINGREWIARTEPQGV